MNTPTDTHAPNEKHLEDWIVGHPGCLEQFITRAPTFPANLNYLMGRQVPCSRGFVDLLYFGNYVPLPVELKIGRLDADCLAQVLAYMNDVTFILKLMWLQEKGTTQIPPVHALLIGHSFEDDNLLRACVGANVSVLLYEYKDGDYSFQQVRPPHLEHHLERFKKLIEVIETWNPVEVKP